MADDSVEKTNSGVKKSGDMEEVAEFAEEVKDVMKEEGVDEDEVERFDKWRPRKEDGQDDIEKKTAKNASLEKNKIEEQSKGKEDITRAGGEALDAGKKLGKAQNPEPELKDAYRRAVRPLYSGSVKIARFLEENLYSKLMMKFNPYFFDSKDFSVDLKSKRDGGYTMDVDSSNKKYRESLKSHFKEKN